MEKNELEDYLKRLEDIDRQLNDESSSPDDLILEVNKILNSLSSDIEINRDGKSSIVTLKYINKSNNPDPTFAHEGDSGFDLRANLSKDVTINEGSVEIIPTGLYFEVNKGLEIQIRSRSGMAVNSKVFVLNSPGTVDCVTEDTVIKTIHGNITIKKIFEEDINEIFSFNEENFITEVDIIDDIWIVNDIECLNVKTENSSVIIPLTKEVYTKRGWVQSKDLTYDDEILTCD